MNLNLKYPFPTWLGALVVASIFVSCEEELTTIGGGVVGSDPFTTGSEVFHVFAYNKNIEAVRTNKLGVYQLGVFNDPVFGRTDAYVTSQLTLQASNPTFGKLTQSAEDAAAADDSERSVDEDEKVVAVHLYIPYLTRTATARDRDQDGVEDLYDVDPDDPNSDSDGDEVPDRVETAGNTDPLDDTSADANGDGLNDSDNEPILANTFAKEIELDSVYYNNKTFEEFRDESVQFDLKVQRSTYFLRDLDPNANFQEAQPYYSSQEFSPNFVSDVLYDSTYKFSNKEILIPNDDDPETPDVDESETFTKLGPGIRVALDTDFFQENILNKEGQLELLSQANFNDFLRGLHLSITGAENEDFYMLFDLRQASITMTYTYKEQITDNNADEEDPREEAEFVFSFLRQAASSPISGNAVNTFVNGAYPADVASALDNGENASRIFVKGGAGATAQILLFEPQEGGMDIVNQIKENNWVVNEANLVFYIDQEKLNGQTIEPPRLYLYNQDNNLPLYNPITEQTSAENLFGRFLNYDGIIEKSDGAGVKYTVNITDHINNMIVRDSVNAPLGLTLATDIQRIAVANAMLTESEMALPDTATITPLGTVLYGPNIPESDPDYDKRLRLEIIYTEID